MNLDKIVAAARPPPMIVAYALEIQGRRVPARFHSAHVASDVARGIANLEGLTLDTDVRVVATFDR